MDRYLAVIGDVVGSRRVADRSQLQQKLGGALTAINQRFAASVAASFVMTIGDEFQGLLSSADGLIQLLAQLNAAVHPVELRLGIGIGGLTTPLRPEAVGMDGPCFHRARTAIERARDRGTPVEVEASERHAVFEVYSLLFGRLRDHWTDRQRQVHYLAASGMEGKAIAQRLGISPSAVSQHLRAADSAAIHEASRDWVEELSKLLERRH